MIPDSAISGSRTYTFDVCQLVCCAPAFGVGEGVKRICLSLVVCGTLSGYLRYILQGVGRWPWACISGSGLGLVFRLCLCPPPLLGFGVVCLSSLVQLPSGLLAV